MEIVAKRQKAQITQQMAFIWIEFCIEHRCCVVVQTANPWAFIMAIEFIRLSKVLENSARSSTDCHFWWFDYFIENWVSLSLSICLPCGLCESKWVEVNALLIIKQQSNANDWILHTQTNVRDERRMARKDTGSMVRWWDKTVTISKMGIEESISSYIYWPTMTNDYDIDAKTYAPNDMNHQFASFRKMNHVTNWEYEFVWYGVSECSELAIYVCWMCARAPCISTDWYLPNAVLFSET